MELFERARALEAEGHNVVHLEVGEPDFPSAPTVVEAGIRALNGGYTPNTHPRLASHVLRERVSQPDYAETGWGSPVDPERVVVTAGASGGSGTARRVAARSLATKCW